MSIVDPDRDVCDFSDQTERVTACIDDAYSAVMVEVVSHDGNPVELFPPSARVFATGLLILAERLDERQTEEILAGKRERVAPGSQGVVTLQRAEPKEVGSDQLCFDFGRESAEISALSDGHWVAHTKVVSTSGGPVALDPTGARRLATALLVLADRLD